MPKIKLGLGEARIERERPAKALRCFLVALLFLECDAEAVLRNRRTRLRDHRAARQDFSAFRLTFPAVNLREKQKRVEILRVEDEDSPDRGLSGAEPTVDVKAMSSRVGPLLPVSLATGHTPPLPGAMRVPRESRRAAIHTTISDSHHH